MSLTTVIHPPAKSRRRTGRSKAIATHSAFIIMAGVVAITLLIACSSATTDNPLEFTVDGVKIVGEYPQAVTDAGLYFPYQQHKKTRLCVNSETGDRIRGVLGQNGLYHPIEHTPYTTVSLHSELEPPENRQWDCSIRKSADLWRNLPEKYLRRGVIPPEKEAAKLDFRAYVFHAESRKAVPIAGIRLIAHDGSSDAERSRLVLRGYKWEPVK